MLTTISNMSKDNSGYNICQGIFPPVDMPLSFILDDNEHEGFIENGIEDILPFMERSPGIPDRAKNDLCLT